MVEKKAESMRQLAAYFLYVYVGGMEGRKEKGGEDRKGKGEERRKKNKEEKIRKN